MADDLTLKISADATGVTKGVKTATSSLDTLNADAAKASKSMAALGAQKVAPTVSVTLKDQAIVKAKADIAKLRDEVARGLSMGADTRPAQRRIAELQRSIRSLEDKPHVVKVDVAETAAAKAKLAGVGSQLSGLSTAATAARTGILGAFAAAIGGTVKLSADMETLKARFASVVGEGEEANRIFNQIRKFADSTPFEFPDLVAATTTLKGFGVSTKDLVTDLQGLGEAAAKSGASVNDIALIYGQMLAKGKLESEDVLQLANRQVFVYDALARQLGITADQARQLGAEGKITREEIEKLPAAFGEIYKGSIARQAETFNGQMSTLADNVKAVGVNFGDLATPALKDWVSTLNNADLPGKSKTLVDVLRTIGDIQSVPFNDPTIGLQKIGKLKPAIDETKTSMQGAVTVTKNLADAYADAKSSLDGLLASLDVLDTGGISRQQATINYQRAIDDVTASLKENGRTLDVNKEQGRQNREALTDVAQSIGEITNARLRDSDKSGESTTKILDDYARMRDALITQATRFTGSRQAAQDYVDTLLDTPDEVKTEVKVTGVDKAKAELDKLTQARQVQISLNLSISRRVQNELNRFGASDIAPRSAPQSLPPEASHVGPGLQVAPPTQPASPALRSSVVPQGTVAGVPVMLPALTNNQPQVIIAVRDKRLADLIEVGVRDAVTGVVRTLSSRQVVQT